MVIDVVSDMLTRIRNAGVAKHEKVSVPQSKLKEEVAKILLSEGYISNVEIVKDEKGFGSLVITLKYNQGKSVISGLKRISKPGLRVYANASELPKVLNGLGIAIISTSKGILTDKQAREKNIGGEVLAYVW